MTTNAAKPVQAASPSAGPTPAATSEAKPRAGLHSHIMEMLTECPSRQAFFQKVLGLCLEQIPASVGCVEYLVGEERKTHLVHDKRMQRAAADRFNTEFLFPLRSEAWRRADGEPLAKRYHRGEQKMLVVVAPVMDVAQGKPAAVVSLIVSGEQEAKDILPRIDGTVSVAAAVLVSKTVSQLKEKQAAARAANAPATANPAMAAPQGVAQQVAQQMGAQPIAAQQAAAQPGSPDMAAAASVIADSEALAKTAQFGSTKEFGYSITNALCAQLKAEQVNFGIVRDQKVVVEAISNVPDFKPHGPGVQIIRQAMEECLDANEQIVHQNTGEAQADDTKTNSSPIHRQWSADSNGSAVMTVPLRNGEDVVGIISIRRSADKPFRQEEAEGLQKMLQSYGAALPVIDKANLGVGGQLKHAAKDSIRSTFGKGSMGRWLLWGGLLCGLLWFVFGTLTYRPICRTRVIASDMRHFAAPLNAKLKTVDVVPGQQVAAGDVLATFETSELRMQLNSLKRQISAAALEMRQAMEADQLTEASLARARANVLRVEAANIMQQIKDSTLVAPVSGTVVLSDLEQRVGQMFPQGQEVLQLAAESEWMLEIEIPDDIANLVVAEQQGTFSAASQPTEKYDFTLQGVDGSAMLVEDRNVFIGRAPLESRPEWLMNGMEGTARIETVERPVWWVAMHRAVDWARLNYWL